MTREALTELFTEQIRDLYDAENQLLKALPKIADAAQSEDLADGLRAHLEETKQQVSRLEEIFALLQVPAKGKPCKAMKGLLAEGDEALEEEEGEIRDLAIIAGCQRVEHYEISAYGTARTLAEHLEMDEAVALLEQTEDEETDADAKLTAVALDIYGTLDEEEEPEAVAAAAAGGSAKAKPKKK